MWTARPHSRPLAGLVVFALLSAGACSGRESIFIPMPPNPVGARSLLMGLTAGPERRVFAVDLTLETESEPLAPIRPGLLFGVTDAAELDLAFFEATLASLQLTPGRVESTTGGDELPPPLALTRTRLAPGATEADAWAPAESTGPALEGFRLPPGATPCARWEAVRGEDLSAETMWAIALSEDRAVFADERFRLHVIGTREDGRQLMPSAPADFATQAGRGRLVGSSGNSIVVAHFSDDAVPVVSWRAVYSGSWERLYGLTASTEPTPNPLDPPREIYTLSNTGRWERFADRSATLLHTFEGPASPFRAGKTAWLGPDEAVAVWPGDATVARYNHGVTTVERVPTEFGLISIGNVPGIGLVATDSFGRFYSDEGRGAWTAMPESPTKVFVFEIQPFRGGFVFGTSFGGFGEYIPGFGFCPFLTSRIDGEVRSVVLLKDEVAVLSGTALAVRLLGAR